MLAAAMGKLLIYLVKDNQSVKCAVLIQPGFLLVPVEINKQMNE